MTLFGVGEGDPLNHTSGLPITRPADVYTYRRVVLCDD